MQHKELNLSFGRSKTAKKWSNQTVTWADFVERLRQPTVTQETEAEYQKMTKAERDTIKDVGGFVAGWLKGGRRKAGNVINRSLIALDADTPQEGFMDILDMMADYAYVLHSTHSHTASKPRYRVLIPTNREMTAEEYEPVSRYLAKTIGMTNFDDTTYQAERIMFLPSCARDADYIFKVNDDSFLDVDEVLATYPDWRDTSFWPESPTHEVRRQRDVKRQGDPLSKPGLIGAFCRTYDIQRAINELLTDVYVATDKPDRYTYANGSTSGGLVIYEDKFAYSHHGTDPVGDQLVNAFDLVRIHLYGDLDEDVKDGTATNKTPSFKAMSAYVRSLDEVKALMVTERLAEATEEFDELGDWVKKLTTDDRGAIEATAMNLELIMSHDKNLKDSLFMDTFAKRWVLIKDVPWRSCGDYKFWKDSDDSGLRIYLEKVYGISQRGKIDDALTQAFERHSSHPVREYLDGLVWDGQRRVDTLLIDYLGAEDCEWSRLVARKILVAAVARVRVPGIKFDEMVVTSGPQGIGKSLLPAKLAGEWFSDSLDDVRGKDAYEALQGTWIMEMGEMTATKKADLEATKHFISKREDVFRVAYGRRKEYFKRECIFWGTTNDSTFLRDKTGNRRFWPVDVGVCAPKKRVWHMTEEERSQIWAEAKHLWDNGESLYLNDEEKAMALEQQQIHTEENELEGMIVEFLSIPITEDWYSKTRSERRSYIQDYGEDLSVEGTVTRTKVCVQEVWCEMLGGDPKNIHPAKRAEIRQILDNLEGWMFHKKSRGRMTFGRDYGLQNAYVALSN